MFQLINPHLLPQKTATLFLPGWGFDGRLLTSLFDTALFGPLIVPSVFTKKGLLGELPPYLQEKSISKLHIVGWSMGGSLALDFASLYPQMVVSVGLFGVRSHWPMAEVNAIKQGIIQDLPGFMKTFYRKCFLGDKVAQQKFEQELQEDYLTEIGQADLVAGLGYLADWQPANYCQVGAISIFHGEKDVIAPLGDLLVNKKAEYHRVVGVGHFLGEKLARYLQAV